VINFITTTPGINPQLKISAQGNNIGYKRAEIQSGFSKNKWGFALSGYYASKTNGFMDYSDFHKATVTAKADYRFNNKTDISNSATWVKYYSEMPGSVDSAMFVSRTFSNPQTFTYRKVDAFRYRSTLNHSWNDHSKTTASLVYRDNSIGQNPNYRIKDDYRKSGNVWIGSKELAHGEISENGFNSYAFISQHKQNLRWKNASITAGVSMDFSPSGYHADYIRIKKDTVTKKYISYQETDSVLSSYQTSINNFAAFTGFEFSPAKKWRIVASLRYDLFHYQFNNHLAPSSFSGSRDTVNNFKKISSKIGFTYNFSKRTGLYANYSQGFVPPQVSEMYTGVKVPDLRPAVFNNYEIGGWAEIISNKLSVDASIYHLQGNNELVSVKLDDGSSENRNTGKTEHRGIEFGLNATTSKEISLRLSGAYSEHRFLQFIEKGNNYNGKEMNGAPRWIHNAEFWYKPSFAKGLRLGAEWQKVGSYFIDPKNSEKYEGYNLVNLRAGYELGAFELWLNVMNAADSYYSNNTTKTSSGESYQLAEPRSFQFGLSCDLAKLLKK
jgi:outer membrane receptor protein involved in Fe transport